MNDKDERIFSIWQKTNGAMTIPQIARKIGYGNPPTVSGIIRVQEGLERKGIVVVNGL